MINFLKNFFSNDKDAAHVHGGCDSHKHEHDVMHVGSCGTQKPMGGCGSHAQEEPKKEEKMGSGCCGGGCH